MDVLAQRCAWPQQMNLLAGKSNEPAIHSHKNYRELGNALAISRSVDRQIGRSAILKEAKFTEG